MPVVLLCHCDGTSGSTTFIDSSSYAHTLSASTVTVDTTNPKFGTGDAYFANAFRQISVSTPADFNLGSGQFTVEAWVYWTVAPGGGSQQGFVTQWPGSGSSNLGWFFGMVNGQLSFTYSISGTTTASVGAAYTPALNTWISFAVDRDASNMVRVYANGAVIASGTVSGTIFASTVAANIGNNATANGQGLSSAYIDEIRVTTGLAQYGGPYTPANAPFGGTAAAAQALVLVLA